VVLADDDVLLRGPSPPIRSCLTRFAPRIRLAAVSERGVDIYPSLLRFFHCYGQCAGYWPPLIAAKPTAGAGLKASLLGTTKRRGGKLQVTYGGHPLYFFAQDKKAGDLNGQGFVHFGGAWWVVSAAGKKITVKP
jgi:hypothetical protein